MGRFDRYMLSQLMWVFGFFSLVLVLVYWINRAVSLFDQLIANGHSAIVFLEFTALALPNVIRVVLPVSGFAAAVYVTNRMSNESELVAVQASGFSPWRMARPVLAFGAVVALFITILTHVLVPLSLTQLAQRTSEIAQNVTARLLNDGVFLHPSDGVTFYIREITPDGELQNIFLTDTSDRDQQATYTAERALLLRADEGPQLLMFKGMIQNLNLATNTLVTTRFEQFAFDIGALVDLPTQGPREIKQVSTVELLSPTPEVASETRQTMQILLFEGHARIAAALIGLTTPLVGFAVLLLGGYSRFGIWRQIVAAVICLIAVQLLDNAATDAARAAGFWPAAYAAPLFAALLASLFLWMATAPAIFARRKAAS